MDRFHRENFRPGLIIHRSSTQVAASLSSTDCFLLQSGSSLFIWHGNSSTFEQQQWAGKVAEFLKVFRKRSLVCCDVYPIKLYARTVDLCQW